MAVELPPLPETTSAHNGSNSVPQATVRAPEPRPGPLELSPSKRRSILVGIWMATFLSSLNSTLVATLVSTISSEYKQSNHGSWLGTSYLLATCTFTPLYGRLCNVMGRRGANQTAVVFAGLGTLWCGMSTSLEMLVAARFLSGIGGGGIIVTATVITSDMYSMRDRSLTQGIANIFNGLGLGLGGPLGGYISDRFGWRWAFLVQIPIYITSFVLTGYNLTYITPGKGKTPKEILKRIDYGGSATLLSSIATLLLFLSYKYNDELDWHSPAVLVTLCLSIVLFVLFIIVELLFAVEPVLAPFLLRQRVPVLIGISNSLVGMCNFAVTYFFPLFFETVMLTSSSTAGLHLLPNSVALSSGSLFAGWVLHKTGRYRALTIVFGILPFIATVSMVFLSERSSPFAQWVSIIPLGLGNSVILQTTFITLLAHVDSSSVAVATGFSQLWRGIGQVSGVAVASAVFQSLLDRELKKRIKGPEAAGSIHDIRHSSRLVATLPPDLQRAARDAYAYSLRRVFIYAACSTFLAFLVRLGYPEKSLDDPRFQSKTGGGKQDGRTEGQDEAQEPLLADDSPNHERRSSTYELTERGGERETHDMEKASHR